MAEFKVEFSDEAKLDLFYYSASERKIVTSGIRNQLLHQPLVPTRNRKLLRVNPVASWELRIGEFRVFYEVDEGALTVTVVAVGHKEHNVLLVRGQEVRL
jgi:mRNA-degrading endonuclease RelE of RelBE toxin-antitoxin system